jgi:hypothetical protein
LLTPPASPPDRGPPGPTRFALVGRVFDPFGRHRRMTIGDGSTSIVQDLWNFFPHSASCHSNEPHRGLLEARRTGPRDSDDQAA